VKNINLLQKRWFLPALVTVSALILLSVCTAITVSLLCTDAENRQGQQYHIYTKLCDKACSTTVTVTEGGEAAGTYTLAQLGVLDDTLEAIDAEFDSISRMDPAEFAKLPMGKRLSYRSVKPAAITQVPVAADDLDISVVMQDLTSIPREDPKDAYVEYMDGTFCVVQEIAGTTLLPDNVQSVLIEQLSTLQIGTEVPASITLELTEYDCYVQPQNTLENSSFDFSAELKNALKDVTISVTFHDSVETLTGDDIFALLQADAEGNVSVRQDKLTDLVAGWHQTYRNDASPYRFEAQVGGVKPIDFLLVDYEVNQDETRRRLEEVLLNLSSTEIEAEWYCWRKGEAFALKDEYVEVDITNQKMTYVKNGEVLVCTDVVTGNTWGYPTPTGLFKVENKDTNCWLSGEDYNVHVDYWIGFVGYVVGIHDADWRTKFGGQNYVRNGSHGCVNTPKEATAMIFENIEVGVPVLVYNYGEPVQTT